MNGLLEVPNSLGWWRRDCRMISSGVTYLTSKLGQISPILWRSKVKLEAEGRLTPGKSPSYTCRQDTCSFSYLPMVCCIPFSQTVLVFPILNLNSSGQGLPLVTVLSTAFAGTAQYTCNGYSSMSQKEGASMYRPLKQKIKGSAKAKEMIDNTSASVLPTRHEGSHPRFLLYKPFSFFDVMSALVSCNNQKFLEDVELLFSLSVNCDYKSPSPQCCQFNETER